ncbi:Protein kinase-like domain [Pseudocohnilembus persalinus]|uniref:Protein kinase-like domain n=1 Tax=Pseudocohnilembus persalinus TaxID=266149 RepID=A0A0V0R8Z0_PSEPJ|nr:Protein kinase-like domain [Pseudocohnilembus persalinus]|eukprot:KRX10725.1 Protein kinase-like domain [Pseudocohnilembus persalinus]
MQNQDNNYDYLKFAQEKSILKVLEKGEQILLTCMIAKFNRKNKKQDRNFMITNQNIFNLSKTSVKRRISVSKIAAISVSVTTSEFVLHVPEEYDYRYNSNDKRDEIISTLIEVYNQINKRPMRYFELNAINLEQYTTTKEDKKKKIDRTPTENGRDLTGEQFRSMLNKNQEQVRNKTNTLYSYKKGEKVTINDFNLLKVVGRGAFGKVMLVEKKDTKEVFALKSIRKEDIIDKDQIEHTKTERVILEHCNSNFLVNLIYAFTTPEKIFFVTQFMRGGELFQHLKHSKRFDEYRAKFYCAQIALALGHLHAQNIIYRDLKPENILMDEEGNICLTDFGMAKIMRKGELAMSFCGTPEYLSPEIITGIGHSSSADWWALGIFTFEMLFALPPFYSENQDFMFNAIQNEPVKFPNHTKVTEEAKDFILKCTDKDPRIRLGSKKGIEDIKAHPWFSDIDWELLAQKKVKPPFKPNIQNWENNFDEDFVKEEPINSFVPSNNQQIVDEFQEEFEDFSYAGTKLSKQ